MSKYKGEIPNYYWDPEKEKYFSIQTRSSGQSDAYYSSDNVKRQKLLLQREIAATSLRKREEARVQRSRLLESTLSGGFLAREQGLDGQNVDAASIYAAGLVNQGSMGWPHVPCDGCSHSWVVKPQLNKSPGTIDVFGACEDHMNYVRINVKQFIKPTMPPPVQPRPRQRGNRRAAKGGLSSSALNRIERALLSFGEGLRSSRYHYGRPGLCTSLTLSEKGQQVAMTWLSGDPASGIVIRQYSLGDEDEHENEIHIFGNHQHRADVYTSVAAPANSPLIFALGTSRGVSLIDTELRKANLEGTGDVLALEFLSGGPGTFLSGYRSGKIDMVDWRVSATRSLVQHPSSVTHIKHLDSNRIIVAGLASTLCQYDLRFLKDDITYRTENWSDSSLIANYSSTQMVLQYPEYYNTATINVGFDVDLEGGVVAACQEHKHGHEPVGLFSLWGGHALYSPNMEVASTFVWPHKSETWESIYNSEGVPWRSAQFVQDDHSKFKSLYVGQQYLTRFSWVPDEWEEYGVGDGDT